MERDKRPRWKKKSGGTYRTAEGKVIKPGNTIYAYPEEIKAFLDVFQPLDPIEPEKVEEKPKVGLKMIHKGGGRYQVFNEKTNEPLTDKLMSRTEAQYFVGDNDK